MAGSNLRFVLKNENTVDGDHKKLIGREAPLQHPLDSIYRFGDRKSLKEILSDLELLGKTVHFEVFNNLQDGQTVVKLTNFTYNPNIDHLYVALCGIDMYEGTDKNFIYSDVDEITFNFPLKAKYELIVVLGGIVTSETFGDNYDSGIRQFRQLSDVPKSYFGSEEKVVVVNKQGTGLEFSSPSFPVAIKKYDSDGDAFYVNTNDRDRFYFPLTKKGIIKSIQVEPVNPNYSGNFEFKIWSEEDGYYLYYSGNEVYNILYDIMDIPFTDETGFNAVFVELYNKGTATEFTIKIFVLE